MKKMVKLIKFIAILFFLLAFSGCAIFHARIDNTKELMEHPEFESAVKAAPNFVDAAFEKITSLERIIESQ